MLGKVSFVTVAPHYKYRQQLLYGDNVFAPVVAVR